MSEIVGNLGRMSKTIIEESLVEDAVIPLYCKIQL